MLFVQSALRRDGRFIARHQAFAIATRVANLKRDLRHRLALHDKNRVIDADAGKHAAIDNDNMVNGGLRQHIAAKSVKVIVGQEVRGRNHRASPARVEQLQAAFHEEMVGVELE